jgi:DNA polymerase-3 subunit beta
MSLSFTMDTKDFAALLGANVLSSHPAQDIYARMVLSTDMDADHLCVLSSDGEMRLEVRGNCKPGSYGTCTVPGKLLADISRYFSAEQVHVEQEGSELKITSGRSQFSVPAGSAGDYPAWLTPAPPFIRLDGDELAYAFKQVVPSAGEDPVALSGVLLELREKLSLVTTDRNRMAVVTLPYEEVSDDRSQVQALLPAKSAEKLARNLEGEVSVGWNAGVIFMQYKGKEDSPVLGGEMMMRLIAEPYPKWRTILAKEPSYTGITFDTKQMIRAVKMAQLAAGADDKISWTFSCTEIAVKSAREGRECTEYVSCTWDRKEEITFLLGARYVLDGLAGCDETAEVTFTDQVAPLFLRSGKLTYMVQPRRELL